MQIVLVTDAWHPQVNGVVHTWTYMRRELEQLGHALHVIAPDTPVVSRTVPAPSEPSVRLCIEPRRHLTRAFDLLLGRRAPDALHIATEGPLGLAARRLALLKGWRFTTSYHTRFPEYLAARMHVPPWLTYRVMRWFHKPSKHVLVPTRTVRDELERRGFDRLVLWPRGVDPTVFQPVARDTFADLPRPIFLSAGRVAIEKNVEAFLALDLPGSKVVVGDGPDAPRLQRAYPQVRWVGMQAHDALAAAYSAADVFVFPSRTDTFGLVMLEAMACGCPVAAYPVAGPADVVAQGLTGVLNHDLREACLEALKLDRQQVRAHALRHTWSGVADILLGALAPLTPLPAPSPVT